VDAEKWGGYATNIEKASASTETLTTFTHGLSSAGQSLYEQLNTGAKTLGLQRNEMGLLRAVWGETIDVFGQGSAVLDEVADSTHTLDRQASNATSSLGGLQSLDFGPFAEAFGVAFVSAEGQVTDLGEAAVSTERKFAMLGEGEATGAATEAIQEFHSESAPPLDDLAGKAGRLQSSLLGIPRRVRSSVSMDIKISGDVQQALSLGIPLGQWKAISKELATGGPLADLALVGEEGPELIIDGIVVPTRETRKLMSLGLLPKRRYALGGPLGGGGAVFSPPQPEDFDPLNLEQRALLRGGGTRPAPDRSSTSRGASSTGGRARSAQQEAAELAPTLKDLVEASLAPVVPQVAIAAAQAAGSVAPASITAANAQLSRELARNLEITNDRLLSRVDQLILETRRMKTYFRDAVRLITD
jgi:hypothetical protein